ncbi:MAG: GNAT family N-acetyltransferase, partial [Rhodospirillaceae bacterium]|nr:GNAT family N-acetyltransferase [Rhodospirillaceae bacterium]
YIWYAFRHRDSGRIKGMACYLDVQPSQGVIEIGGIWFAPDLQRTQAATEALFLMLDYAMTELRYRRMQWRCNALNQKSRNAALRLGFKYEGIFYNHMIFKGLNRDTAWYSILDSDWPAVRKTIAAWLDAGNFDGDGLAQSSLTERMSERLVAPRIADGS